MDIPSSVANSQLAVRGQLAQNSIKQNADTQKQLANVIEKGADDAHKAAASNGRGSLIDILA